MKKLLLVLCLAFSLSNISAQKTYALLTGISRYSNEEANLNQTTKDIKEIRRVLINQGFTVATLTSKYVNHDNIVRKLNAIVKIAKPEDRIMFFYSGHGDTGGMLTYEMSLFKYNELINILSKAKTKKIFCFIDACRSGSAGNALTGNYGWNSEGPNGITFMLACRDNEFSFENSWVGNGFFTKALLKGMRGMSDMNKDKKVTLLELFKYVYNDVTARTSSSEEPQHPQLFGPKSMHQTILFSW